MARLLSNEYSNPPFAGEYGNLAVARGQKTLAASQIADTIDWFVIPGKATIVDAQFAWQAMGAAATFTLGWRYADGSAGGGAANILPSSGTTVAAGIQRPVDNGLLPFTVDKDIIVYSTQAGAAATGRADVKVEYEFRGTV
ncbi:MAG TPA: hypothetical protein PKV98_04580 [Burkholderiaceae bacterium]|nr:hypothetical protein [Burkholderiaceae bacterium]